MYSAEFKIKILDLFCGAGGCAVGYNQAGFEDITGVDIKQQSNYPFKFIQADAIEFLKKHGQEFDFIHASPPCQGYSKLQFSQKHKKKYPKMIKPLKVELKRLGKPYVIENVPGAPLSQLIILDGRMFGLGVIRKRLFEIFPHQCILTPDYQKIGSVKDKTYITVAGAFSCEKGFQEGSNMQERIRLVQKAMGIDWTDDPVELRQAIPPAYTKFIGKHILYQIFNRRTHHEKFN